MTHSLTLLYNYRAFLEKIKGLNLSIKLNHYIIILNIHQFSHINDTYSHNSFDQLLIAFS